MSANSQLQNRPQTRALVKRFLQLGFLILLQLSLLLLSAGRLDWAEAWAYIGLYTAIIALNAVLLLPHHADLVAERSGVGQNAKGWDKVMSLVNGVAGLSLLVVAGLDERFAWSPSFAISVQVAAFVLMALGFGLFSWAMVANAYFSTVVRIQTERGHSVASGGPYRFVRHPGYVGMIVYSLATAPMLGSLWALIPAGILCIAIVVRTGLEDATLQKELPGYIDYARTVRYRLFLGLW